jgi:predicted nucleic acid-binding protein
VKKKYYLDTNIWLNLFKKEGDLRKGVPYWKIAKDFIQKVDENEDTIIVSTIVLKEIFFTTCREPKLLDKFLQEKCIRNSILNKLFTS